MTNKSEGPTQEERLRLTQEEKLRLALAIVSGRYATLAHGDQWTLLGYDPYKFSYYGTPSTDELKLKAEEIIIEAILNKEEQ